jgi:cell division protease FtsH
VPNDTHSLKTAQAAAFYCVLRRALRQVPDFVKGADGVVLLNVPAGQAAEDYDACAETLLRRMSTGRDDMGYMMIASTDKPRVTIKALDGDLDRKRRVLLFREANVDLPFQVSLKVDIEIDIPPMTIMDFRIGCRIGYQIGVSSLEAEAAMSYPLPHVWAALRRRRPIKDVLARLASASSQTFDRSKVGEQKQPLLQDMHGYGAARQWGLELAQDLIDWQRGKINWSDIDTGIVLSGPPGVGKTQFAAALARQCDIPIIAASLARWQANGHLGDLLKAMRSDFNKAKESAPCILFCDELDSFGDRNSFAADNRDYSTQVVNGFLEHLDGLEGREGVVVIGATNALDRIDPAILRPGRLNRHVAVPLPTAADRIAIFQQQLGQPLPRKHHPSFMAATEGFSGADLAKVARDAKRAARRAQRDLAWGDILKSMPEVVAITGKLRRALAVHEAGHTVAILALDYGKFCGAMIINHVRTDRETVQGGGAYFEIPDVGYRTAQTYRDRIAILLAGMAAEYVLLGAVSDGAGSGPTSDLAQATRIATVLQSGMGMGDRLRHSLGRSDHELQALRLSDPGIASWVDETLRKEFERARQIVCSNLKLLEAIAEELEANGKVSPDQVAKMVARFDAKPGITHMA